MIYCDNNEWVYVLRCMDNKIYVGKTNNIKTRLYNHESQNGKGSIFTQYNKPLDLIGLYNTNNYDYIFSNKKQIDNRNYCKEIENEITILLMKLMNENWNNVCGGDYLFQASKNEPKSSKILSRKKNIEKKKIDKTLITRPICYCNLPCDIFEQNDIKYWACCKFNINNDLKWNFQNRFYKYETIRNNYKRCKFYIEYNNDHIFYYERFINKNYINWDYCKVYNELTCKSEWMKNIPKFNIKEKNNNKCVNCNQHVWYTNTGDNIKNGVCYDDDNKISFRCVSYKFNDHRTFNRRLLCRYCFIEHNDKLKEEYSINEEENSSQEISPIQVNNECNNNENILQNSGEHKMEEDKQSNNFVNYDEIKSLNSKEFEDKINNLDILNMNKQDTLNMKQFIINLNNRLIPSIQG
jgi:predicted GIY-YIG superfamily endonuclease